MAKGWLPSVLKATILCLIAGGFAMAFDGVVISSLVSEFNHKLVGGRIYKIYQPETDEICMVIKNRVDEENITSRVVLCADASLPLMYISDKNKENPAQAPNFCMLLRKHIGNGRIIKVRQPGFERIVEFTIEHLDEMGDLCRKKLIMEIMGKHSNIIFTDEDKTIIDSIKHISYQISSVREVLPGREYVYPPAQDKINPLEVDINYFINTILRKPTTICKAIYTSLNGISPTMANEIAFRAGVDGGMATSSIGLEKQENLYREFLLLMDDIREEKFRPCIAYKGYEPKEFGAVELTMYGNLCEAEPDDSFDGIKPYQSISRVIEQYYQDKSVVNRIKQRSIDLRKIVSTAVERTSKKYDLQINQLKDTDDREKYKVYGELITAYGYNVVQGQKELECDNYYTGEKIIIPLDEQYSAMENAKRYFAKYNKQKRSYEALVVLTQTTARELDYLLSVQNSLEIAKTEADLQQIKAELIESGYIKGRVNKGKNKNNTKGKPLHFVSDDGYDIYVGKNNYQNEELTFEMASGNDLWFHSKRFPGSHVIVRTNGDKDIPDRTYEQAAKLAAFFSTGKNSSKVEIDYTERKNLKKPPKSNPGYVIYHTNYSMAIEPDIHGIKEV